MKKRVKLYRAQEGMQVQDPQQLQQALIAQIQSDMQQGVAKEQTVLSIYNAYSEMFNNPVEVQQFVDSVYESLMQQQDSTQAQMQGQEDADAAGALQEQIAARSELEEADEMAMAQMGMQVGNPSYFTGIDAYVPPNYIDMMSNPAFAYGGQKSKYVKDQLALVKKQMGGQDEAQSSGVDQIGQDERRKSLQGFISMVKDTSTMANAKKQAEQQYDQMMAQMGGQEDFTHYTYGDTDIFHDQMNYLAQAQYGGMTSRQQRQLQKSMSRIPFGAIPTTPVERIDVRKSGIFGRPKEYSIDFASPLQAIGAPGGAGAYGYGINQSTTRKTEGKKGTVEIPGTPVENKQEVAKAEQESGATTSTGTTTGGTGGTGTGGTGTGGGNTGGGEDNTIVETPKPKQGSYFQYIPGRPYAYVEGSNGNWLYKGEDGNKWQTVTNEDALAVLNTGQSKSGQLLTLPGKEGYYYRRRNDGSYIKFKGDASQHYEGKAPVKSGDKPLIIKPGDKNFDYLEDNAKWMLKPYIPNVGSSKNFTKDLVSKMYPYTDIPHDYLTGEEKEQHEKDLKIAENIQTLGDAAWDAMSVITGSKNSIGNAMARNMPLTLKPFQTPRGYLNPGQPMMNPGQPMLNPGQGMLNPGAQRAALNPGAQRLMLNPGTDQYLLKAGQKMLNPPAGTQFRLFAAGGNVMNPMSGMFGKLQEFVYGGGDDPSVPYINQADVNYTNSKDTSDAYFQDGGSNNGVIKGCFGNNCIEKDALDRREYEDELNAQQNNAEQFDFTVSNQDKAINQVNPMYQSDARAQFMSRPQQMYSPYPQYGVNPMTMGAYGYPGAGMFNNGSMAPWYAGSWNQVQKGPYTSSGQIFSPGAYGPNGSIAKIDVTKSNWRGNPKKYSITYSNPNQLAPRGTGTTPAAGTAKSPQESMTKEPKYSNTEGLGFRAASAIRRGERQTARQLGRGEDQNLSQLSNPMERMATAPLNQMRVTSSANQAPMNRMPTLPGFRGGKLRGAQYGGYMQDGGTPVDQDERFQPLPTKSAQTAGNELMMQSRQNIQDQANFLPEEYTVDYKVKNAFNVNYPMAMNAANAIGNIGASFLENKDQQYQGALTQEELTGRDARKFSGNFTQYGEFRPDRQGNKSNSAFSKYGGATEGDELYMTEEEIERFLAEGGELEYL